MTDLLSQIFNLWNIAYGFMWFAVGVIALWLGRLVLIEEIKSKGAIRLKHGTIVYHTPPNRNEPDKTVIEEE